MNQQEKEQIAHDRDEWMRRGITAMLRREYERSPDEGMLDFVVMKSNEGRVRVKINTAGIRVGDVMALYTANDLYKFKTQIHVTEIFRDGTILFSPGNPEDFFELEKSGLLEGAKLRSFLAAPPNETITNK